MITSSSSIYSNSIYSNSLFIDITSSSVTSTSILTAMPSPSSTLGSAGFQVTGVIIAASSVILVAALFVFCLVGVVLQCVISKRRNITHTSHFDFPSSMKSSTSSQPNLRSINTSDLSINTMETGSTHVDKTSQEVRIIKRLSTLSTDPSNPPNSPITIHRSIEFMDAGDEMSVLSRPYSEMELPIPRVPNPSMNFDAISDNISSVSQHRVMAVYQPNGLMGHHSNHLPPPYQLLDYIDEDAITQYSILPFMPHPLQQPDIPLARLHLDNISENTCTTVSMTTFNEPCTDYVSHGDVDPEMLPHDYDCPPPPSPVTEYSLH